MKKIIVFLSLIFLTVFTSCGKEKSTLDIFWENLKEANSYEVDVKSKRDFPPYKFNLDTHMKRDGNKFYTNAYLLFKEEVLFDDEIYAALNGQESVDVYRKENDAFVKKNYPLGPDFVDISLKFNISSSDFTFDKEANAYEMKKETLKKLTFTIKEYTLSVSSLRITDINDTSANLKAYIAYNSIQFPVYIDIYNINQAKVELPNV